MKFFTVIVMCILSGAEVDLFIPSFPELQQVFDLSPFLVQLTLSVNFCAYCLSALVVGVLGDRYGRKPLILVGLIIFILGSILCVFSSHYFILLLGRLLQGLGIAGPAVLAYVVIADEYSAREQQKMMGLINGIITLAMAFAPVIGSYVNLFFNWQGNFILLLMFGIICLILCYLYIPDKQGDSQLNLSFKSYLHLIKLPKVMLYTATLCLFIVSYWVFISMAPILFMEDMQVSLRHFGYYQGAQAAAFSLFSLVSPYILNRLGQKFCFILGCSLCATTQTIILVISLFRAETPMLITGILLIDAIGAIFPYNILYPLSLETADNAKGKISAIILASRLILTSVAIEIVSYFHYGNFLSTAIAMFICTTASLAIIVILLRNGMLTLESRRAS